MHAVFGQVSIFVLNGFYISSCMEVSGKFLSKYALIFYRGYLWNFFSICKTFCQIIRDLLSGAYNEMQTVIDFGFNAEFRTPDWNDYVDDIDRWVASSLTVRMHNILKNSQVRHAVYENRFS